MGAQGRVGGGRRGRPRRAGPLRRRAAARRGLRHGGRVRGRGRRAGRLRARVLPLVRGAARALGGGRGPAPDGRLLARVGPHVPLRGPLARRGGALAADPQGAHRRRDRGRAGRADHLAARAARRGTQLGLPLLLAARRHVRAGRDAQRGLRGGGLRLAGLAAARGGRQPRADCRSSTACGASGACRSSRRAGWRATPARARCGSATRPPSSSSSTCTARSST